MVFKQKRKKKTNRIPYSFTLLEKLPKGKDEKKNNTSLVHVQDTF